MFSLKNFEGPLDLLWQLVVKDEIDIATVPLHEITTQFCRQQKEDDASWQLNEGAEFIALTALLIWYKSLKMLPKIPQETDGTVAIDEDPKNILYHLIDYCRFKQAAKELSVLEQHQGRIYHRGIDEIEFPLPSGLDHLSLQDLATLFENILEKSKPHISNLQEDPWKVSDKITFLLKYLQKNKQAFFEDVFHSDMSREELIVTFLALLELMKAGKVAVANASARIVIKKVA